MKQKTKILLQFSHTKRGKNGQIIKIKTNKKKISVFLSKLCKEQQQQQKGVEYFRSKDSRDCSKDVEERGFYEN